MICVFQYAFGDTPQVGNNSAWLEKQAALMDVELQSLILSNPMDDKFRESLQERFAKRSVDETVQLGLVKFLNAAIDEYASLNTSCVSAIKITQTMIFVVVRLFSNLYSYLINKSYHMV